MASDDIVLLKRSSLSRLRAAVQKAEAGGDNRSQANRDPYYQYPAYVFRVTGTADANGIMPGKILRWNSPTLSWVDVEDCYIIRADTI